MATFKAIVEAHYKRADGTYNIRIRVTHNRRNKLVSTQLYATQRDLTAKLKIKNTAFIDETNAIIKQYREICNRAGERLAQMSVEQVVELIKFDNSIAQFDLDFIEYGRKVAEKLKKDGRAGNANTYTVALNSLVRFAGRKNVSIGEITPKFLQRYVEWLEATPSPTGRKKGGRAASLYLSNIRALHNMAKAEFNDEDVGIIRIPQSPFAKFKMPRTPITPKRAIELDVMQRIIDTPYRPRKGQAAGEFNRFNLAKDVFLLSFGLIGMNIADLFSCTSIENGRITYNRTKTKNRRADGAEISVRIEPQVAPLVEKYRDPAGQRVFSFYKNYANANTFSWNVNKLLKQLGEIAGAPNLQLYAARHTWATLARNEARADMHTVQEALNHVNDTTRITDIYIKRDRANVDNLNSTVLALLDFTKHSVIEP